VTAGSADVRAGITTSATAVRRAPGYDPATQRADWAVVQLDRRLDLPTLALTPSAGYDSGTFTVVGWGSTTEDGPQQRYLRSAAVPFVSDARCAAAYPDDGFVPSDMLCAGDLRRGGVDSCQGDSGGPMIRAAGSGRWVQVGIVSWGNGCGRAGYPGVYTQVSTFTAAIQAMVATLD
jgi:secreted trypsin-like serine protease